MKKNYHVGGFQLPMFEPEAEWKLPTEFPDLSRAQFIGIDVESRDPYLNTKGPGFIRGDAEVVGISLATEYGFKIYLPFAHAIGPNLEKKFVVDYVKAQVSRANQVKVGANLMYELEALWSLGIDIIGPLGDIQVAEPLLDEEKPEGYSLDASALDYLGYGKNEDKLRQAAADYGLDPKKDLWRLPPKFVGEYAEDDAYFPILIYQLQLKKLQAENLMPIFELERDLQPVLWKMRKKGVRIDLEKAERLNGEILTEENQLLSNLRDLIGMPVDPWSSKSLAACFRKMGLEHEIRYTKPTKNHPDGQPSFTNEFFIQMADRNEFCQVLGEYRATNKMRRDFIDGMIMEFNVNGRLHPQWHQLRADDEDRQNGTRSGRIASSKVNLTQIPSRHPRWGKLIRSMFVADHGGKWCKHDYSQQEPRLMLHFAFLKNFPGAAEARQRYIDDPSTDYHQLTADLVREKSGQDIGRRPAKDINLGSAYGMGKWKLASKLGVEMEVAEQIFKAYHEGVPYVKKLEEHCMNIVAQQGFIRTLLGRKRRFSFWEPADWDKRRGVKPVRSREEAEIMWGDVARAMIHKALNGLVQGSAADQTKKAIVLLDSEGLTPHVQVYDELNTTIYDEATAWRIKEVMESAVETTVPHLADPDVGPSWGEVEELVR